MSKVLFIGAHPDDVELGCGGTIYKYCKMGFDIHVLMLAEGSSSRYNDYNRDQHLIRKDVIQRKASCKLSLHILKLILIAITR